MFKKIEQEEGKLASESFILLNEHQSKSQKVRRNRGRAGIEDWRVVVVIVCIRDG